MSRYAVAHLDEIEEISDGRCPSRPIRHHFGITSFGVNAWTGREAGDRIINEHDEGEDDGEEELYFVHRGAIEMQFGDGSSHRLDEGAFARVDAKERRGLRRCCRAARTASSGCLREPGWSRGAGVSS